MINKFTFKKSNSFKIKQINNQADWQSGKQAVRQSGSPGIRQPILLNFFFVIITFSIVTIMPSFQTLKADNCKDKCSGIYTGSGAAGDNDSDSYNQANCEEMLNVETTSSNCRLLQFAYQGAEDACPATTSIIPPGGTTAVVDNSCTSARSDLIRAITQIGQTEEADRDRCLQEKRRLDEVNLPPGCKTRTSKCATDAEKCRDLRGQLGSGQGLTGLGSGGGSLGITSLFQSRLASECPQAAAAKYDDDKDKLRDVTNDFDEAQDQVYELQGDLQEGVEEMQSDRVRLEREIQETTNEMNRASAEFERTTNQISDNVSGHIAQMKSRATRINRQIREKITAVDRIRNNDNDAADRALVAYKTAIRGIFTQCDREARQAVENLRAQLNTRVASGKGVQRLEDATQENRIERLRQLAVKTYAKCRSSQNTQNQVQAALEQYRIDQRSIDRGEQQLIDEIDSLREELEGLEGESHIAVTSGDKAYQAAHTAYVDDLKRLNQELQLKNFEKQSLGANFDQQQRQLQARLFNEQTRATQLNGEMAALDQVVKTSSASSVFGRLDYGDYRSLDEYESRFRTAHNVCCPGGKGSDPICESSSSSSYRRSRGRR